MLQAGRDYRMRDRAACNPAAGAPGNRTHRAPNSIGHLANGLDASPSAPALEQTSFRGLFCPALPQAQRRFEMAGTDTFIFRVAFLGRASTYRDIEIDPAKSLYLLAEAIVSSFDFDFDHA